MPSQPVDMSLSCSEPLSEVRGIGNNALPTAKSSAVVTSILMSSQPVDMSLSCSEPLSEVAYLVVSSVHDQGAGVMIIASLALQEFTIKLGFVTCRACVSRELYPEEVAPDTVTVKYRNLYGVYQVDR